MRVLDLFSGACGGWSLGLHRAGMRTVAAVEIDAWRRAQFARNFPDVRLYEDVRELSANRLFGDGIRAIDVVCGSPPCQDASSANTKGRGIDGERTGLYMEAVRLVDEVRPRWCAFENVPGIRNRGIDRVLRRLEEAGYSAWPLVVGALDLGAPHIRKRSWVIGADAETVHRLALPWDQPNGNSASAFAVSSKAERRAEYRARDGDRRDGDAPRQEGADRFESRTDTTTAEEPSDGRGQGRPGRPGARAAREQDELIASLEDTLGDIAEDWNGGIGVRLRVDDGIPKGMAQPILAAYGDAILPQISEMIGRAIMAAA